jgi:hypothetical protein
MQLQHRQQLELRTMVLLREQLECNPAFLRQARIHTGAFLIAKIGLCRVAAFVAFRVFNSKRHVK